MEKFEWLIVGLGNPGQEYARTRHNIGWMVAEAIRVQFADGADFVKGKGRWTEVTARVGSSKVLLVLPQTYMNVSGEAVEKLRALYRIPNDRILALVDEYNFPVGKIHLKQGGSGGGHNGIASMMTRLQTDQFWRLRCGIDKKFLPGGMADYVLGEFPDEEMPAVEQMMRHSIEALKLICKKGAPQAMSLINSVKFGSDPRAQKNLQVQANERSVSVSSAKASVEVHTFDATSVSVHL
jgi:PTH1 family peptidyl-tRNA hydrolase